MAPAVPVVGHCAALLAAGLLLAGPAPGAHACTYAGWPTERVPLSRATAWQRRVGVPAGPGHVEAPGFPPLPAEAVVFYGTATAAGGEFLPDPRGGPGELQRPVWTFTVEDFVQGHVADPQVTVVGSGSSCDQSYRLGVRQPARSRPTGRGTPTRPPASRSAPGTRSATRPQRGRRPRGGPRSPPSPG